jgi:DNA-binding NarL/FixJ family response regulator
VSNIVQTETFNPSIVQPLREGPTLMCLRILVADDAELIRKGIRSLLSDRDDIAVIGEASDLPETIRKTAELLPDVVIIDVRMTASVDGDLNPLTMGRPTVAISFAIDEIAREQAERLGAVKFIDKMELANELVPTLLQFAPANKPS